jgi:S-formylglutathione hydrolase FrmB
VQILTDGAGPFGDPYQVNSANNGPYGDALTQELIPHLEKNYRCGGQNRRFTTGGSTGGWVSLALQLYYPEFFNGCWSSCPDSVDFRDYELIDIYSDKNAYVNKFGFERPSQRTINGDTVMTLRHECQVENVIGRAGNWNTGGKDWCSWNATYGPRGADGLPAPLWHPKTGEIDRSVVEAWKKHDLRLVLEGNWPKYGSVLKGKIHVWVGDADDYFLNNAVHRFKAAADRLENPKFDGEITIAPRKGHTSGWNNKQILDLMVKRAEATR